MDLSEIEKRCAGGGSIGSFQFRDAKRFKRVDVIGTLPMIVEPKEADCDAVGREVGNDKTVLLHRLEVFLHL
jgi:hypothetical protein